MFMNGIREQTRPRKRWIDGVTEDLSSLEVEIGMKLSKTEKWLDIVVTANRK